MNEEIKNQFKQEAEHRYQTNPMSNEIHRENMATDRQIFCEGAEYGYTTAKDKPANPDLEKAAEEFADDYILRTMKVERPFGYTDAQIGLWTGLKNGYIGGVAAKDKPVQEGDNVEKMADEWIEQLMNDTDEFKRGVKVGFIGGHAKASQKDKPVGMEGWVKASDRLPNDRHKKYFIRWKHSLTKEDEWEVLFYYPSVMVNNEHFKIEWLDESPSPSDHIAEGEIDADSLAVGFAEWLDKNFVCIYDNESNTNHWETYGLQKDKHRYSTPELLHLYKQSAEFKEQVK